MKTLYKATIGRLLCFMFGHRGIVDTNEMTGVCDQCGGAFHVSYDMTYGETLWLARIKK